jgi:hypothetical protein
MKEGILGLLFWVYFFKFVAGVASPTNELRAVR